MDARSGMMRAAALGSVASTPRPYGEDVVPVRIDVVCGSLSTIVLPSDEDARRSASIRAFEGPALELARRLSGGAVTHRPD